ncbi:MAG: N-acetylmuramoyl-L-alanine amidase [Deltaproteobacteria bacterium]|nr:N-acetylmuramoyl-L-alanine amidase [Deltaproteobacteria bacterium]
MTRMSSFAIAALLGLAATGCVPDPAPDTVSPVVQTGLDATFAAAGAEFDVPPALLAAIGYVESRWQMVEGTPEFDGAVGKLGVMGLRTDALDATAARIGADVEDLRQDAASNVRAAAAQLADLASAQGIDRGSLDAWRPVVAAYAHIDDADAQARYVDGDVYGTLATGAFAYAESGELIARLEPQKVAAIAVTRAKAAGPDYAPAVWRSSPNYGSRPSGVPIWMVVIHTCEGNYAGCWGWLRNSAAQASAHYVVNESGSEISQLVREANRAWHVAASYACSHNGNYNCGKNGQSVNNFAIGIEHAGFASQASFPAGQIEASAKLTCDITRDHGIPRDRNHIVGHGQLQPSNRVDPGPNWPWSQYIDRVRTLCGDNGGGGGGGGSTGAIIVDSNNANNTASVARIELTGTWTSASSTPGYYGSGYWFADTSATAAPATFWFYLDAAGSHAVDAWWTAGPNRAAAAPFIAFNAAGSEVGRVTKDQRASGSKWTPLGTWSFTKGWNKIVLSRWTTAGAVVIADAVRVR